MESGKFFFEDMLKVYEKTIDRDNNQVIQDAIKTNSEKLNKGNNHY